MADWLNERKNIASQQTALVFGDQVWAYEMLDGWVNEICNVLLTEGISGGQIIGVLLPNHPLHIAVIHALARLGVAMLPMNTRLTGEEMRWQLANCDYRFLLCNDATAEIAKEASEKNRINLDRLAYSNGETPKIPYLERSEMQGIFYTSGTTGKPKGVALNFDQYFHSAMGSAYRLGLKEDDRWLLTMPLYHIGGQSIVFRACLYGIAIVLQDGFDPEAVYRSIETDRATLISVVPTMLHRLMPLFKEQGVPEHLRVVLVGGAKAATSLVKEGLAIGLPIALTYGLTEATSQVATAPPSAVRMKPGSAGKALFGTQIEIVDSNGAALASHEIGEVVVSGKTLMREYYNNPEATEKAIRDDKLYTSDLGYLDEDGDLWIVTRRSDLIVSGGENVYPAEVEAVLLNHEAVREACVVGLEDVEWGQVVSAAVVPEKNVTKEELIAFCRLYLAGYKLPRQIEFFDSLPKTASGKILRRVVADQLITDKNIDEERK